MASPTSVSPSVRSVEAFSVRILENIVTLVGDRLKDEELKLLKQARDDPLRSLNNLDPDTSRFFRLQQQQLYQGIWHDLLQKLRRELPQALCDLLKGLEGEMELNEEPMAQTQDSALMSPRSATFDFTDAAPSDDIMDISMPTVPVAEMGASTLGVRSPARSVTPPPDEQLPNKNKPTGSSTTSPSKIGSPVITPTAEGSKRPLSSTESPTGPNKRARISQQNYVHYYRGAPPRKPIRLADRKVDECVFRYKNHEGLYILRCNRTSCKDKNRGEIIIFQSDPFKYNLAMNHFSGQGHGIRDADEIFNKYARKVLDATEELNLKRTKQTHPTATATGSAGSRVITPSTSPQTSRDKGKQPERQINLSFNKPAPKTPSPKTRESKRTESDVFEVPSSVASSSAAGLSTSNTVPAARSPAPSPSTQDVQPTRDGSPFESLFIPDDDEDDEDYLPPLSRILTGRSRKRPGYKEKPAGKV
ncbi:hypothetical protein F5B20DRAFT_518471 [Whalleya microplaca]|nr:hypothetical protein F5B20DRAFT_518471 [Whalleya microplaca]